MSSSRLVHRNMFHAYLLRGTSHLWVEYFFFLECIHVLTQHSVFFCTSVYNGAISHKQFDARSFNFFSLILASRWCHMMKVSADFQRLIYICSLTLRAKKSSTRNFEFFMFTRRGKHSTVKENYYSSTDTQYNVQNRDISRLKGKKFIIFF